VAYKSNPSGGSVFHLACSISFSHIGMHPFDLNLHPFDLNFVGADEEEEFIPSKFHIDMY